MYRPTDRFPVPHMITAIRMTAALAVILAVAGCGGSGGSVNAAVRDSAGVQIVENRLAAGKKFGWTVGDSATVDIGGGGAGPMSELSRVVGIVRTSDGKIALANVASSEIRYYDSTGQFVMAHGRQGAGPGEYLTFLGLWLGPNDSLLTADMAAQRLAVVAPGGTLGRHFSLGGRSGFNVEGGQGQGQARINLAIPQGWLADGSIIGVQMPFGINSPREGAYRDSLTIIRFGPDGMAVDTVGRFPGLEFVQMKLTLGGQNVGIPTAVPLGKSTVSAVDKDRLFIATNAAWEVEEWSLNGTLTRLIRLDAPPTPLTPDEIDKHREQQAELMGSLPELRALPSDIKEQMVSQTKTTEYPKTLPFIAAIIVARDGMLWVQESMKPSDERQQYAVFDADGQFQGRIRMPDRFQPMWITPSEVMGVWRDPDDVEHVRSYPLKRS